MFGQLLYSSISKIERKEQEDNYSRKYPLLKDFVRWITALGLINLVLRKCCKQEKLLSSYFYSG